MAQEARNLANTTRDVKRAAEALKAAEEFDRLAEATEAELARALAQLRKPQLADLATTRGALFMTRTLAFVVCAVLMQSATAHAEIITRCGASSGWRYDLRGPLNSDQRGWKQDQISKGEFLLIRDGKDVDIVYSDVAGTRSSKADGATMILLPGTEAGTFIVVTGYASAIAHYTFSLDQKGAGEVVWGAGESWASPIDRLNAG